MRDYAYDNGKFYDKNGELIPIDVIKNNTDNSELNLSIDKYIPNNPNTIVMPIVDNLNLFTQEKENGVLMSKKETMAKYSEHYCIRLRNRFGMSPVNIQQQAASNESIEGAKMDMKEPSSSNLADHKGTTRDVDVFITLHSPYRAGQKKYAGYDIEVLEDHYRSFRIDLDRDGQACETNLYFDGATSIFRELPEPNSPEMVKIYEFVKKLN